MADASMSRGHQPARSFETRCTRSATQASIDLRQSTDAPFHSCVQVWRIGILYTGRGIGTSNTGVAHRHLG